jgi:hypothetical protein
MDDRELLEFAAKAIYLPGTWIEGFGYRVDCDEPYFWNPLTDDGEALRLAVKLKLDVEFSDEEVWVTPTWNEWPITRAEEIDKNIYAATRRAIVEAAAEVGRGMK